MSESVPVPGPPTLVQRTARSLLALAGWSVDLPWPPRPRGIIVVYPHTSNWDFVVGMLALLATGLPAQWVGKDTLFRWPFGRLLRCLGGIPVAKDGACVRLGFAGLARRWYPVLRAGAGGPAQSRCL